MAIDHANSRRPQWGNARGRPLQGRTVIAALGRSFWRPRRTAAVALAVPMIFAALASGAQARASCGPTQHSGSVYYQACYAVPGWNWGEGGWTPFAYITNNYPWTQTISVQMSWFSRGAWHYTPIVKFNVAPGTREYDLGADIECEGSHQSAINVAVPGVGWGPRSIAPPAGPFAC